MQSTQKNPVALVTGAAKNMGRAFAIALAKDGYDLTVHYHSDSSRQEAERTAQKIEELGRQCLLIQADLTQVENIKQTFSKIINRFGHIDIVINNAGLGLKKSLLQSTEEDFEQLFNINAKSAFFVMQEAAKHIQDFGRIINIGTSLQAAFTGMYSVYSGSKQPLEAFTKALAKEIGDRGITVNTIAPGPINTEFLRSEEDEQTIAYLASASVANRLGEIDDIVPFVQFLASKGSQWMTGQTLLVNGGFVTR